MEVPCLGRAALCGEGPRGFGGSCGGATRSGASGRASASRPRTRRANAAVFRTKPFPP